MGPLSLSLNVLHLSLNRLLVKQFNILRDLLEDPSPIVRATGAEGVCRIGNFYWELIPTVSHIHMAN